ncbi:MAG: glycosyltransferase family 2 protein [Phycisphaera sp.]|nr:glycosyltransferase family 2 protein [Phycisphaera sp.]
MPTKEEHRLVRKDGKPSITAYVIAYNEAEKIEAAISSVLWADEVILADSHSTDGTIEIAERLGARVVQIDFDGFGKLRNSAIAECRGDWIFSLDADERCTPEARDAILGVVADRDSADIWRVPRRNWFMGRWIRHCGWYPNFRQPQLFRNGRMHYDQLPVHEGWIAADGAEVDVLPADIWQVPFRDLGEVQHKANRYSTLGAEKVLARGGGRSMLWAVLCGLNEFNKHYVFKLGILDGWAGFMISFGAGEGAFYKHAKAYASKLDDRPPDSPPLHREDGPRSPDNPVVNPDR